MTPDPGRRCQRVAAATVSSDSPSKSSSSDPRNATTEADKAARLSRRVIEETLEIVPFGKLLHSSHASACRSSTCAYGLPG